MKTRNISSDDIKDAIDNPKRSFPELNRAPNYIYISKNDVRVVLNSQTRFVITVINASYEYSRAKSKQQSNKKDKRIKREFGSKAWSKHSKRSPTKKNRVEY